MLGLLFRKGRILGCLDCISDGIVGLLLGGFSLLLRNLGLFLSLFGLGACLFGDGLSFFGLLGGGLGMELGDFLGRLSCIRQIRRLLKKGLD